MAKKTVVSINKNGNNVGDAIALDGVKPVKIKAQAGVKYMLKDAGDVAPENATLTRVGDDLHVTLEGESSPALVLEGYFGLAEPAGIYGMAEDGQLYAYGRTDGGDIFSLAEGESSAIALAGDPIARGSDDQDDNFVFWPLLLAGGLAAAGISATAHSGGSKNFAVPEANVLPEAKDAALPAKSWISNSVKGTLDDVGAVTGPIAPGGETDDTRPEFNGIGEADSTIIILDNGQPIGTAKVDKDGNWSFTPEEDLGEGDHSIVIIETDKDGNKSEPSDPYEFTVDTTAPNKPELGEGAIDDVGAVTGPIAAGGTTDDARPELKGDGEPDSTIIIVDNGQPIGTAKVDKDGNWSFTPEEDLGEGDHSIVIIETDINTGANANTSFGDHLNSVGDVNGDGYEDFLLTYPLDEVDGMANAGSAYLVFGQQGGFPTTMSIEDYAQFGVKISGTENYENLGDVILDWGNNAHGDAYFGSSNTVSSIGDINGDGIGDFIIGSPGWGDGAEDGLSPGRAYVVFGKKEGWTPDLSLKDLNGTNGFVLSASGTGTNALLGNGVRAFGDVNGDGIDDFMIGAPNADTDGKTDNGAVYLLADGKVQMQVNGANGEVDLQGSEWTRSDATVGSVHYNVYTNLGGTVELLVEDKVHVTIL
ncbi:Ig-like domain-containing protein [Variovorax sp. GT1P44]|uniref:integrin alpha n=1 Tax=Variovorax sp. GT1P44 TaxID=3443742 RepID=UPI003F4626A9